MVTQPKTSITGCYSQLRAPVGPRRPSSRFRVFFRVLNLLCFDWLVFRTVCTHHPVIRRLFIERFQRKLPSRGDSGFPRSEIVAATAGNRLWFNLLNGSLV